MKTIKLKTQSRTYEIKTGNKLLNNLGRFLKRFNFGQDAYIITNSVLKRKYGARLTRALKLGNYSAKFFLVPDSEASKSLNIASSVIKDLANYDKKKRIFIIAFGGGVIGDVAGFVASIYKRGIPFIQIPTTLLAQVDSSIGGKTGVDLEVGKNLIGTFYQPALVLSDVELLRSLDKRQMRSGLAEVIKYAAIMDAALFKYLEGNIEKVLKFDPKAVEHVIFRCAGLKAKIVQQDEKEEKGIRTILNFGHTIGHAIEAACNYKKYSHGEAIALGMLVSSELSYRLRLLEKNDLLRIEKLIAKTGLPVKLKNVCPRSIIKAHYRDKKFIGSRNRFVLLEGLGRCKVCQNVDIKTIQESLKKIV
ncbi:MAG: 3-dehydroquinate synthase [Candidatus Omnitrophota bacterium]